MKGEGSLAVAHRSGAPFDPLHQPVRSPTLEWFLKVLVLLNATRKDASVLRGSEVLMGAMLDELLSAAEGRLQRLQGLKAPPGMSGLFDGLLQLFETWRDVLAAIRAGDPERAMVLAGDVRRKSDAIWHLININLGQEIHAFRAAMKGDRYVL